MNINTTDKYVHFIAIDNISTFMADFKTEFFSYTDTNVIVDLSNINASENEITLFEEYATLQAENELSFVIVLPVFDADAIDDEINVVPTLTEAIDIIDMDQMTRDLGF